MERVGKIVGVAPVRRGQRVAEGRRAWGEIVRAANGAAGHSAPVLARGDRATAVVMMDVDAEFEDYAECFRHGEVGGRAEVVAKPFGQRGTTGFYAAAMAAGRPIAAGRPVVGGTGVETSDGREVMWIDLGRGAAEGPVFDDDPRFYYSFVIDRVMTGTPFSEAPCEFYRYHRATLYVATRTDLAKERSLFDPSSAVHIPGKSPYQFTFNQRFCGTAFPLPAPGVAGESDEVYTGFFGIGDTAVPYVSGLGMQSEAWGPLSQRSNGLDNFWHTEAPWIKVQSAATGDDIFRLPGDEPTISDPKEVGIWHQIGNSGGGGERFRNLDTSCFNFLHPGIYGDMAERRGEYLIDEKICTFIGLFEPIQSGVINVTFFGRATYSDGARLVSIGPPLTTAPWPGPDSGVVEFRLRVFAGPHIGGGRLIGFNTFALPWARNPEPSPPFDFFTVPVSVSQ